MSFALECPNFCINLNDCSNRLLGSSSPWPGLSDVPQGGSTFHATDPHHGCGWALLGHRWRAMTPAALRGTAICFHGCPFDSWFKTGTRHSNVNISPDILSPSLCQQTPVRKYTKHSCTLLTEKTTNQPISVLICVRGTRLFYIFPGTKSSSVFWRWSDK